MTKALDLRQLDWHPDTMITSLIPALSCRNCRPHAPFAELVKLSPRSIADDLREDIETFSENRQLAMRK
jgi:hypothetical protein